MTEHYQPAESTVPKHRSGANLEHPLIPAGRVNGTEVYSASGEKLGHIEDVAIDKVSGQVAYAILRFGGWFGIGSDYHPVPWRMLTYDREHRGYVIPCEKEQLEQAPGVQREELSGWDDTRLRDPIYQYYSPYGATPYWL